MITAQPLQNARNMENIPPAFVQQRKGGDRTAFAQLLFKHPNRMSPKAAPSHHLAL